MEIDSINSGDFIDIVGIIRNIGEVENIKDDTFVKREVTLKDDLKNELTIVLWNKNAKSFNGNVNDVMSIKAGKVVEYKGIKKVSVLSITILKFNDKSIPEVKRLLKEMIAAKEED
ncbi:replication factor A protein 1 [Nasonia vitripennis]|uniref:Replication protein A OB domain-containing protein n=2 Tax=Pteromalinae TaxID=272242 RepID=A0A7M7QPF0_NASVI|nr:replication factor A protein 1 [Nasonia vitripennis]XP_031788755.1 replication factor A protein 1 [Nasonia vitripennis]XP_031788756.1 replication factor A protein 1 [Nasonia vitripennis]